MVLRDMVWWVILVVGQLEQMTLEVFSDLNKPVICRCFTSSSFYEQLSPQLWHPPGRAQVPCGTPCCQLGIPKAGKPLLCGEHLPAGDGRARGPGAATCAQHRAGPGGSGPQWRRL